MLNGTIKEFKVIRAKWLRGSDSELLDENGKMCCLGFVCSQLGISKELLQDKDNPYEIKLLLPYLTDYYHSMIVDSSLSKEAIQINDDVNISDSIRESKLIKLFKQYGLSIKFEGYYDTYHSF